MYCNKCGARLYGKESFCPLCGNEINEEVRKINTNNSVSIEEVKDGKKTASIVLGILSLVGSVLFIFAPLSFVLAIIGLILGIVASKKVNNALGIVLNSIGIFLSLVMSIFMILLLVYTFNSVGDTINELWNVDEYYESDYNYNYYDDFLNNF